MEIKNMNDESTFDDHIEKKEDTLSKDFLGILDNVITKSEFIKTCKISPDLEVELRVLDVGELLVAESRIAINPAALPTDIALRARNLSIVAEATVSLNGVPIKRESMTEEENRARIRSLYNKYLKLPSTIADKICNEYKKLVKEQGEFLSKSSEELKKDIENF